MAGPVSDPTVLRGLGDLNEALRDSLATISDTSKDINFDVDLDRFGQTTVFGVDVLSGYDVTKPVGLSNVDFGVTEKNSGIALKLVDDRLRIHSAIVNQAEEAERTGELTADEIAQRDASLAALEKAADFFTANAAKLPTSLPMGIQLAPGVALTGESATEQYMARQQALKDAKAQIDINGDPLDTFTALGPALDPTSLAGVEEATTDEQKAAAIRGAQQCWLLYNSPAFSTYKMLNTPVDASKNIRTPGYQSPNLQGSGPASKQRIVLTNPATKGYGLQNKLNYRNGTRQFFNIATHEYAQLSPMLRIYKVRRDPQTRKKVNMVELEFSNATTLDGIAKELTTNRIKDAKEESLFTRGSEAGVKSFEWQFIGSDQFTATRDISATLKLHAQSMAVLTKVRNGPVTRFFGQPSLSDEEKYRYIDLLVQPECQEEYSPDCFEVRIDVGYAPLDGSNSAISNGIKEAIKCQKDVLYLVLVDHAFEIAEDGSIDITVNFKGRLETLMKTRKTNVLLPFGGSLQSQLELETARGAKYTPEEAEARITTLKKKSSMTDVEKKEIKEIEVAMSDLSLKYKQIIHSHILDMLLTNNLIYEFDLNRDPRNRANFELFKRFQARLSARQDLPPRIGVGDVVAEIGLSSGLEPTKVYTSQDEAEKASEAVDADLAALSAEDERKLKFFYFGDLVAIVLQSVTGDNTANGGYTQVALPGVRGTTTALRYRSISASSLSTAPGGTPATTQMQNLFDKFRIIFGNIELDSEINAGTGTKNKINLAHIPISLESYSAFYRNNILASNTAEYPFFDFVDDVLAELVIDPITTSCFGGLFDISFRPKTTTLTVPNEFSNSLYGPAVTAGPAAGAQSPQYNAINLSKVKGEQIFDFCMDSSIVNQLNEYFVIGAEVTDLDDKLQGCVGPDNSIGIPHFIFGNAFGLMKKVTFSKSDIEYLPETRYASEGNFLYNQLANVYDCNIDLLGNNYFRPGQYVYIDTTALGAGATWERNERTNDRSWANLMGLGGYHLVTEVAHSISRDGFHTTLKCRWMASGKRPEGMGPCPDS